MQLGQPGARWELCRLCRDSGLTGPSPPRVLYILDVHLHASFNDIHTTENAPHWVQKRMCLWRWVLSPRGGGREAIPTPWLECA